MHASMIIRVFCVDGPCPGLQYMNLETGRILFDTHPDGLHYIYRVSDDGTAHTDFGPSRTAYFDHAEKEEGSEALPRPPDR